MAAYDDDEELVGLIRAVGDGLTIVFIQDLLVCPHYQRQGIGQSLVQQTLERFKEVYQIQLATEQSDKNLAVDCKHNGSHQTPPSNYNFSNLIIVPRLA